MTPYILSVVLHNIYNMVLLTFPALERDKYCSNKAEREVVGQVRVESSRVESIPTVRTVLPGQLLRYKYRSKWILAR